MEFYPGEDPYEQARVPGGIEVFRDVLKADRTKPEVGSEPIPSPEGAARYAEFVEQSERCRLISFEEDEDLLAA